MPQLQELEQRNSQFLHLPWTSWVTGFFFLWDSCSGSLMNEGHLTHTHLLTHSMWEAPCINRHGSAQTGIEEFASACSVRCSFCLGSYPITPHPIPQQLHYCSWRGSRGCTLQLCKQEGEHASIGRAVAFHSHGKCPWANSASSLQPVFPTTAGPEPLILA